MTQASFASAGVRRKVLARIAGGGPGFGPKAFNVKSARTSCAGKCRPVERWPIGLLILAFLIARGKFGHWRHLAYQGDGTNARLGTPWGPLGAEDRAHAGKNGSSGAGWTVSGAAATGSVPTSSGNRAFDEYRSETLKRLEEEQHQFKDFLARLRFAKDRAEFDQFMAERRQRPFEPNSQPEPPPADPPRN